MKRTVWRICLCLSGALVVCDKVAAQSPASIVVHPGVDIADFVARHPRYDEFQLETGEYLAGQVRLVVYSRSRGSCK